jgi:hypothetical protein
MSIIIVKRTIYMNNFISSLVPQLKLFLMRLKMCVYFKKQAHVKAQ